MTRFVRCIEGHVFDADISRQCPTCGAIVEVPVAAAGIAPAASGADISQADSAATSSSATGAAKRMPLLAGAAAVILGLGIGALVLALHISKPTPSVIGNPVPTATPAKTGAETNSSAAPSAPASPQNNNAAPMATPQSQSSSNAAPAPSVKMSDTLSPTLRTALDVVRMLAAFGKSNYTDATSLAETLSNDNNPIGMFIKAGLFMDGLGGQPRDLTQARSLLAKATELGDPTSSLFYGRVLENGIGGPRDLNGAKAAYLFAARSMAAGADQDLARLHLENSRGMTALEAYQSILNGNSRDGLDVINELTGRASTPAECLYGWLIYHAKDKGWVLSESNAQRHGFIVQPGAMNAARAATQNIPDDDIKRAELGQFEYGARRSDPWCEWGMGMLAATGLSTYPKNLVEADVFYRLAAMHKQLGASLAQVNQELATIQSQVTPAEKTNADDLFHGAVPTGVAP